MSSPSDDIGELLARDGDELRLWRELPLRQFVRLDDTHAFAREHRLVVVKRRDLITGVAPTSTPIGVVAFCRMSLVSCAGVPVAYAITSAACPMRVRDRYCSWSIRGESATDGTPLFDDGTLIISGNDRALVAVLGGRHWTVPA